MFELKEVKTPTKLEGNFQLFDWHGKLLDKARVDLEAIDDFPWLSISTFDKETAIRLNSLRLRDFENRIDNIRLLQFEKIASFDLSVGIFRRRSKEFYYDGFDVRFFLDTDLFYWKQFYGFSAYKKLLKYICEKERKESVGFNNLTANFETESSTSLENENNEYQLNESIVITFLAYDEGEIGNIIRKYKERLFELHKKVIEILAEENLENTLISYFAFPEQIETSCRQYLEYFAQFLRDLGINTTTVLKKEAGKVLFSVTPTDDIEALDKIREALEVYLRLPSSPLVSNSQEIAIQRLESQVEYFRSQIRLARAENQLNQATIQQQQVTIIKLGENVMIDSMIKNVTESKKDNKGEILGGAIQLATPKKLEDYGIKKIDLDKLWKYLKEKFGK